MMVKVLKYFSVILIFSLAGIILINNFRIRNDHELTSSGKYLKHASVDHKINEVKFDFIKINFVPINYSGKKSGTEMNTSAVAGLFLICSAMIFYDFSGRKLLFSEKSLFTTAFKNSQYRPPKFIS